MHPNFVLKVKHMKLLAENCKTTEQNGITKSNSQWRIYLFQCMLSKISGGNHNTSNK